MKDQEAREKAKQALNEIDRATQGGKAALGRIETLEATCRNLSLRVRELEGKVFPRCGACGQTLPEKAIEE